MTTNEELADIDARWDEVNTEPTSSPSLLTEPPTSEGTFGHASERRLGLRVPATCWALLKDWERSLYARTVEISPTGAVLKLLDGSETIDRTRRFELDIFIPGAARPVHTIAWPARAIGQLEAFEFLTMSSDDRLTLAEHLDTLLAGRVESTAPPALPKTLAPPVYWRNFILALKHSSARSSTRRL
ncbi:MAG TPA: hypothetical protein VMS65_07085 [Polyangiaceae bacterium]|nr:hypothetical protein [Polyangiaceae bacterium]